MKDFFELRENKIFFVKVGDGRDSMTVKVKANTKGEAIKKLKAKYPKYPVSLDQNQKQGKPAGALESVEVKESKASAQFTDHTPDKDFNDLARKHKVKVTHDKNDEKTTIHGDENAVLSVLKTMYGNDWKDMYTKKGSTYVDESVKTEDKGQFIYAAKQAKKKGDSTFVFAGKTYNCEEVLENENLDEAVNMGPWNRGAINKAMGKAGIKGKMAKDFIAALRNPEK